MTGLRFLLGRRRVETVGGMRVKGVGSLDLKMHSKTDIKFKLTGVYVTDGIGFNLFSIHDAQAMQTITLCLLYTSPSPRD